MGNQLAAAVMVCKGGAEAAHAERMLEDPEEEEDHHESGHTGHDHGSGSGTGSGSGSDIDPAAAAFEACPDEVGACLLDTTCAELFGRASQPDAAESMMPELMGNALAAPVVQCMAAAEGVDEPCQAEGLACMGNADCLALMGDFGGDMTAEQYAAMM